MSKFLSATLLIGFMLTGVQSLITASNAQVFVAEPKSGDSEDEKSKERHLKHEAVQ